jgi:signal transduction histidine kinase
VIVLEVEDSGEGVPPEEIERLFVPFYTTKSQGTGLGLAISEKVIRAHHGHLRYLRRAGRTVLRAIIPKSSTGAAKRGRASKLEARG